MPTAATCTCEACPKCRNRHHNRVSRANARRLRELCKRREATAVIERREPTAEERAFEKLRRELDPWQQSGSAF